MSQYKLDYKHAKLALQNQGSLFIKLFEHGNLEVELYRPHEIDAQEPHKKDEVYIVAEGHGHYICNQVKTQCSSGDFLFAPAGAAHHFYDFSENFTVWVIFYGKDKGEKGSILNELTRA